MMSASFHAGRRVLWMPLDHHWQPPSDAARHCCPDMARSLMLDCEQHSDPFECDDKTRTINSQELIASMIDSPYCTPATESLEAIQQRML